MDVHHTTITARLKKLNIKSADTRRAFMEDIDNELSSQQQERLIQQLGPSHSIKSFVKSLMIKEFIVKTIEAQA